MVFDNYYDRFERYEPYRPPQTITFTQPLLQLPLDELRKLIDEFKEAVAAARTVDRLTGQPDCADPEKAKLEQRVAELEAQLAAIKAAVVGTNEDSR